MKAKDRFPKLVINHNKKYPECSRYFLANNHDDMNNIAMTIIDAYNEHESHYIRNITANIPNSLEEYILNMSQLSKTELDELTSLDENIKSTVKHDKLGFGKNISEQLSNHRRHYNELLEINRTKLLLDDAINNGDGQKAWSFIHSAADMISVETTFFDEIEFE